MKKHRLFKSVVSYILALAMLLPCIPVLGAVSTSAVDISGSGPITLANVNNSDYQVINTGFQVGFGKGDFTPSVEAGCIPCALGSSETSQVSEVWDNLYATCIALFDGQKTSLVFSVDLKSISDSYSYSAYRYNVLTNSINRALAAAVEAGAVGLEADAIFFNATHNHNAPYHISSGANNSRPDIRERMDKWREHYYKAVEKAARDAIADLAAADAYAGSADTTGINGIRRYYLEDGSYAGTHTRIATTSSNNRYLMHESLADPELQTVHFRRAGKKDIVMVNWQAHAASANNESSKAFTADYVHYLRKNVEERLGMHFIFITGASGNVTVGSNVTNESGTIRWRKVGDELLPKIVSAIENEKWIDMGSIQVATGSHTADIRNDLNLPGWNAAENRSYTDAEIQAQLTQLEETYGANYIKQVFSSSYSTAERLARIPTTTRWGQAAYIRINGQTWAETKSNEYGGKMPIVYMEFQSWFEAFKMYARASDYFKANNYKMSANGEYTVPSDSIPLFALGCGDLGITFSSYEMFDTNGQDVKRNSPFAVTLVAATSNGSMGYIPSRIAWERENYHARENRLAVEAGGEAKYLFATAGAGYEVNSTSYVPGTGEACAEVLVSLLEQCTTPKTVYVVDGVGEEENTFVSVKAALDKAKNATWSAQARLEIQVSVSGDLTIAGGWLLFGAKTIWRANNTKLPITVCGIGENPVVLTPTSTSTESYKALSCANDYTFRNITLDMASQYFEFFAGVGEVVFDNVSFGSSSSNKLRFYAAGSGTPLINALSGWTMERLEKAKVEGLLPVSFTFRNTSYDKVSSEGWQGAYIAAGCNSALNYTNENTGFSITSADIHGKIIVEEGASLTRVNGYASAAAPAELGKATLLVTGGTVRGLAADGGNGVGYHNDSGYEAYQKTERNPKVDIIVQGGVVEKTGSSSSAVAISGGTDSKYGKDAQIHITVSSGVILGKIVGLGGHETANNGGMESQGKITIDYNGGILTVPEGGVSLWIGGEEKTYLAQNTSSSLYGIYSGNSTNYHTFSGEITLKLNTSSRFPVYGIYSSGNTVGKGASLAAGATLLIYQPLGSATGGIRLAGGSAVIEGQAEFCLDGGEIGEVNKESTEYFLRKKGYLYALSDYASVLDGGKVTIRIEDGWICGDVMIGEGTNYVVRSGASAEFYYNGGVNLALSSTSTIYEGAAKNANGAVLDGAVSASFEKGSKLLVELNGTFFSSKYTTTMYLLNGSVIDADVTATIRFFDRSASPTVHAKQGSLTQLVVAYGTTVNGSCNISIAPTDKTVNLEKFYATAASGKLAGNANITIDAGSDPSKVKLWSIEKITGTAPLNIASATLGTVSDDNNLVLTGGVIDLAGTTCLNVDSITGNVEFIRTGAANYSSDFYNQKTVMVSVSGDQTGKIKADTFANVTKSGYNLGIINTTTTKVTSRPNASFSAGIVLKDRLSIKLYLTKSEVESAMSRAGKDLTYALRSADFSTPVTGQISAENLNGSYYEVSLPAVGAASYDKALSLYIPYLGYTEFTVNKIASAGAEMYTGATKALFEAILDYGYAANPPALTDEQIKDGVTHKLTYFDESAIDLSDLPADLGASGGNGSIVFTSKTLLMGDATGIRLKSSTKNFDGMKVILNGKDDISSLCRMDSANGTLDFYIAAKDLNTVFTISVYDADGNLCLTLTDTVKAIASQLATADSTSLKAKATLYFIQTVQNYLFVPTVTPPETDGDEVGPDLPLFK